MKKYDWGLVFRAVRHKWKFSQTSMADMLGTSQGRLSKIEAGLLIPDANEIIWLLIPDSVIQDATENSINNYLKFIAKKRKSK